MATVGKSPPRIGTGASTFAVERVNVRSGSYEYATYRLFGWLKGRRIRRNFKSKEEADAEKDRLEIEAADAAGAIRPINTRLTPTQVAQAEAAFLRLEDKPLLHAVEWFLANYRPPSVEKLLADAVTEFRAAKATEVSAPVVSDYRKILNALQSHFPGRLVHTVKTEELEEFLCTRGQSKKSWNNGRTYLHAFFEYCRDDRRRWIVTNPAKALKVHEIARGIPEIETAAKLRELFAFLETYAGPAKAKNKAGYLVTYFALATFAGIRPSTRDGELAKIHALEDKRRIIDPALGVIRITPEIAKTDDLRQIIIQPNLASWLERYPLDEFPIMVPAMGDHVALVRKRFGLKPDVLRHTFISAYVAKFRSLGDAALQAGNSERIMKKHYLNMMTGTEAAEFWSIIPQADLKVGQRCSSCRPPHLDINPDPTGGDIVSN